MPTAQAVGGKEKRYSSEGAKERGIQGPKIEGFLAGCARQRRRRSPHCAGARICTVRQRRPAQSIPRSLARTQGWHSRPGQRPLAETRAKRGQARCRPTCEQTQGGSRAKG